MSDLVEHTTLPEWVQLQCEDGKILPADKPRWGGKYPPPAIGDRIYVSINRCGPANVTGYFTEGNFLGVLCELTDPPEWHIKQNKGNRKGHVFGPEFYPLKYIILTRPGCEYCEAAKALLGINYIEISGDLAQTFVKEGGFKTFPQIFHNGKHIGGYNELLTYRP